MAKKMKSKRRSKPAPVNGPFALLPVGSDRRFGYRDRATVHPLGVDVLGIDGQAPHADNDDPVATRVRWQVVSVPDGAADNLLSGTLQSKVTSVDARGRAYVSLQLGKLTGVYRVSASLVGSPQSATAYFDTYTDAVAFDIEPEPIPPTPVDRKMPIVVHVRDWRGVPVSSASIVGSVLGVERDVSPGGDADAAGTGGRGGRYRLALPGQSAGIQQVDIGDGVTGISRTFDVEFLPGKPDELRLRVVAADAQAVLSPSVRLSLEADDRFGNLVRPLDVQWLSRGALRPLHPSPTESSAAIVDLAEGRSTPVSVRVGSKRASLELKSADVALVTTELAPPVFTGSPFRLALTAKAPAGGGVLQGYRLCIQEPIGEAERIEFIAANPDSGLVAPELCDLGDGLVEITLDGLEIPLPEEGMDLYFGELVYWCLHPEDACFEVTEAALTIARSPGESYELNAGVEMCVEQKQRESKTLCLHFCIAAKPKAGKTQQEVFNEIKDQVEADARAAQEILSDNVPICCPVISISAEYTEIPWREYQAIVAGGARPGSLEVLPAPWEGVNADSDPSHDVFEPNDKLKELLKKCQSDNCIPIYYVPKIELQKGRRWKKLNGATVSPNDFPETTSAQDSGGGIVLHQGLPTNKNTLIHELGHMLIDLPRGENGGEEHVPNRGNRARIMKTSPPHGDEFTREECSRIFDNIGRYGGD